MTAEVNEIIVAQVEAGDAQGGEQAPDTAPGAVPAGAVESQEASELVETQAGTEVAHAADDHGLFPPFDPATYASQLLWLAIAFAALYFFLSRVALPRIGGILESRQARIDGDLKEADRLRVETERAAAAYEEALAEARRNAHAIAEETRQAIRADIEGKRASVEADLAAKMVEAENRISGTMAAALANVDQIATETAAALVAQLAGPVSDAEARDAVAEVAKG